MNKEDELRNFVKEQWKVEGDPIEVFWPQVTEKRKELGISQKRLFQIVEETV